MCVLHGSPFVHFPQYWGLHHCRISLSRMEQIVYFGLTLLQAVASDVARRVTNSNCSVTD